jgi:PleD family two-component response regulator
MPRTSADAAQGKMDQLLKIWRSTRFDLGGGTLIGASFSVGIADSMGAPGGAEILLNAADDCVLQAKRLGRGRVMAYAPRPYIAREVTQ